MFTGRILLTKNSLPKGGVKPVKLLLSAKPTTHCSPRCATTSKHQLRHHNHSKLLNPAKYDEVIVELEDEDDEHIFNEDVEAKKAVPNSPICPVHNEPTVIRKVTQEGVNRGKYFYKCKTSGCNFFMLVHHWKAQQALAAKNGTDPNAAAAAAVTPTGVVSPSSSPEQQQQQPASTTTTTSPTTEVAATPAAPKPPIIHFHFEASVNHLTHQQGGNLGIDEDSIVIMRISYKNKEGSDHQKEEEFISTYVNELMQDFSKMKNFQAKTVKNNKTYIKYAFPLSNYGNVLDEIKSRKDEESNFNIKISEIPEFITKILFDQKYANLPIQKSEKHATDLLHLHPQPDKLFEKFPPKFVSSLLPFQKEGIVHGILRNGRVLIADEMGLGKSIQAIGIMYYFKQDWPLLIICPSSLKQNWKSEILKWFEADQTIKPSDINIIDSTSTKVEGLINIVSYDKISRAFHNVGNEKDEDDEDEVPEKSEKDDVKITQLDGSGKPKIDFVQLIKSHKFKSIILDESHYLKALETKRTKAVNNLMKTLRVKRVICLSGTASPSRPFELFKQIKLLGLASLKKSDFGKRYCLVSHEQLTPSQLHMMGTDEVFKGAKNLKELNLLLKKTLMIRRMKQEVLNLPHKNRIEIELKVPASVDFIMSAESIQERIISLFNPSVSTEETPEEEAAVEEEGPTALERMLGINLDTFILRLYIQSAEAKLPFVVDYLKKYHLPQLPVSNLPSTLKTSKDFEKFLFFAHHQVMLDGVEKELKKLNVQYIRIDGSTPIESRQNLVDYFRSTPDCLVALLSIHTSGLGLNFTPCAKVVFSELAWTPGVLLQCEDRVHRIGATSNKIDIYYLLGKNTIDEFIWPLIKKKLYVVSSTLDGQSQKWV